MLRRPHLPLLAMLCLLGGIVAVNADQWVANQGTPSDGVVVEVLNGSNKAVPISSSNPLAVTVVSGGTGTATYVAASTTTITVGGTSQTLFGANTIVRGGYVTNPTTATEILCVDPTGAAANLLGTGSSFCLAAGQTFLFPTGQTNAVSINATTSTHAFAAVRY